MLNALRANIAATIFGGLAAIFALVAVVQTVKLDGFLWWDGVRDKLEIAKTELGKCITGRKEDRLAYRQAQLDAKAKNLAEVERIESAQEKITDDIQARYSRDLARLRSERLRAQGAAPKSAAGSAQAGGISNTAPRADAENLPVPRSELLQCEGDAAEIELKGNALIDWIERQLGVKR